MKWERNQRTCKHKEYRNAHCAVMECPNYVNRCKEHGLAAPDGS